MAHILLKTLGGSDLNFRPTRGCGTVVQNSGSHDATGPKIYGEIMPNCENLSTSFNLNNGSYLKSLPCTALFIILLCATFKFLKFPKKNVFLLHKILLRGRIWGIFFIMREVVFLEISHDLVSSLLCFGQFLLALRAPLCFRQFCLRSWKVDLSSPPVFLAILLKVEVPSPPVFRAILLTLRAPQCFGQVCLRSNSRAPQCFGQFCLRSWKTIAQNIGGLDSSTFK